MNFKHNTHKTVVKSDASSHLLTPSAVLLLFDSTLDGDPVEEASERPDGVNTTNFLIHFRSCCRQLSQGRYLANSNGEPRARHQDHHTCERG